MSTVDHDELVTLFSTVAKRTKNTKDKVCGTVVSTFLLEFATERNIRVVMEPLSKVIDKEWTNSGHETVMVLEWLESTTHAVLVFCEGGFILSSLLEASADQTVLIWHLGGEQRDQINIGIDYNGRSLKPISSDAVDMFRKIDSVYDSVFGIDEGVVHFRTKQPIQRMNLASQQKLVYAMSMMAQKVCGSPSYVPGYILTHDDGGDRQFTMRIMRQYDLLPVFSRRPKEVDEPDEGELVSCGVCMVQKKKVALSCGHCFCHSCSSSLTQQTCPICKRDVSLKRQRIYV